MAVAPRGTWFGAEVDPNDAGIGYSYFGLNVAPGFTYDEFYSLREKNCLRNFRITKT
jgi:predicted cupin superfamily sugar epimerase